MELWIGPSKPNISGYYYRRPAVRSHSYKSSSPPGACFVFEAGGTERKRSFRVDIRWDDLLEIAKILSDAGDSKASTILPLLTEPENFSQLSQALERVQQERNQFRAQRDRAEAQLEQVREVVLREAA